ncbi:hypothetical protein [Novosphingobium pokkalii]|uniref:Uncharacterized protein n=1 Tax=Novosphingobium pokkalii TaxID=1770194 RepID=A0ABV7V302_9SPHN|nr:hypothetical protein [Novosphingobium pokkalii]GHC93544.1 hypothetical protein GCM10019060_20650 [Novosphingobium pokkalii]
MHWITLTEKTARGEHPIHVNLEHVSSVQAMDGEVTDVWFLAGQKDGKITVTETPEQIFAQPPRKLAS